MKKLFSAIIFGFVAVGTLSAPASAISLAPCPDDMDKVECEKEQAEILRRYEKGELKTKQAAPDPTFVTDLNESEQSIGLWVGSNLLLAGNNLTTTVDAKNGLLVAAGNNLRVDGNSEYGFVFGNVIEFTGSTERDLYMAGNTITLGEDAEIGRDVFVAGNELFVKTDLDGDLSVTAERVIIDRDLLIQGNLNINAEIVEIGSDTEISGKIVYNDSAVLNGLSNIKYGELETYHVEEVSDEALFLTSLYGKLLSIGGLFLAMVLILVACSKLHGKVQAEATTKHFGVNLAVGLATLVTVPAVAVFALFTVVAAPISIIALLIYGICVYLAQGFTGLWLGHLIIEKLFKQKGNPFLEAIIGIVLLGLLSLVPCLGVLTGFASLVLGLGIIIRCVKPARDTSAKNANDTKKLSKNTKTNTETKK